MTAPLEWVDESPLCEKCATVLRGLIDAGTVPANPEAYLARFHHYDHRGAA